MHCRRFNTQLFVIFDFTCLALRQKLFSGYRKSKSAWTNFSTSFSLHFWILKPTSHVSVGKPAKVWSPSLKQNLDYLFPISILNQNDKRRIKQLFLPISLKTIFQYCGILFPPSPCSIFCLCSTDGWYHWKDKLFWVLEVSKRVQPYSTYTGNGGEGFGFFNKLFKSTAPYFYLINIII